MIKLLLGGSPCTHWSIAQKNNRETEANGLGWELFKNYLIAKEKYQPDYFLYENNKSAAQAIKDQISHELGYPLQYINSALVSAQNRQRFYCHNIPNVPQPQDRGILLRDILESGEDLCGNDKAYCMTARYLGVVPWNTLERAQRTVVIEPVGVAYRGCPVDGKNVKRYEARDDDKSNALTTVRTDSMVAEPIKVGALPRPNGELSTSQAMRIYSVDGKAVTQSAAGGGLGGKTGLYAVPNTDGLYEVKDGLITIKGKQYPIKLEDGLYTIRKLSVLECQRLQTVPDDYIFPVSNTQAYKMLGNGWTVDVIAHILSYIPNIQNEEVEVLSMYDGMSCGHITLDKLGVNVVRYYATEIDKYAIQTTMANYPNTIQLGDAFQVREHDWSVGNVIL